MYISETNLETPLRHRLHNIDIHYICEHNIFYVMTLLHHHRGPAPAHVGFDANVYSGEASDGDDNFPRELRYDEEEEAAASSKEEEEGRRTIEFRIISAQELKKKVWHNLTMVGRMCTVAEAYVDADSPHNKNNNKNKNKKSRSRSRTRVDRCGGRNPVWNEMASRSQNRLRQQGTKRPMGSSGLRRVKRSMHYGRRRAKKQAYTESVNE